jgi:tRNA pseudouridine38-40 synthase
VRYFLRIAFNGTPFHGWQIQQNADSVQAHVNRALGILLRTEIVTIGCGRTDTGVHATKFYLHFETEKEIESLPFLHQINSILPPSIAAYALFKVEDTDHARFSATQRTYHYHIYQQKNPFVGDQAWFYPHPLDIDKMNALSPLMKAHTDFSCFSKSNTQTFTNNCKIYEAEWKADDKGIVFRITADRFLRNMVRAIVGTSIDAGLGKLAVSDFQNILDSKSRSEAGASVPAHGLFLTDIKYPFNTL